MNTTTATDDFTLQEIADRLLNTGQAFNAIEDNISYSLTGSSNSLTFDASNTMVGATMNSNAFVQDVVAIAAGSQAAQDLMNSSFQSPAPGKNTQVAIVAKSASGKSAVTKRGW